MEWNPPIFNTTIMDATINHFSHQHPLQTAVLSPTGNTTTCSGCNLKIFSGKDFYQCKACSFSLHTICSKLPRKTRHPSHPNHCLNLLVSPPNSNLSNCKACGFNLSSFYYNCSECDISYHILCSKLPLSLSISFHPHSLSIEFSPPYNFSCDLCHKPSHSGWLYRCGFCEFDAHISCAFEDNKDCGLEIDELMQLVQQGFNNKEIINNKDEEQAVPSYQCSSCFSIELLKSYECQESKLSQEIEERKGRLMEEQNRTTAAVVFNPLYMAEKNWGDELESFNGYEDGRKFGRDGKENGFDAMTGSKNHTLLRSNTGSSRRSGGWKLLGCLDSIRYKKCSNRFNSL